MLQLPRAVGLDLGYNCMIRLWAKLSKFGCFEAVASVLDRTYKNTAFVMWVRTCACLCVSVQVPLYVCLCVCPVGLRGCLSVRLYASIHVCVCIHAWLSVCVYVSPVRYAPSGWSASPESGSSAICFAFLRCPRASVRGFRGQGV